MPRHFTAAPDRFVVSLEWSTSVKRCVGAEYRQALRDVPRATVSWDCHAPADVNRDLWLSSFTQDDPIYLADWRYAQRVRPVGAAVAVRAATWYVTAGDTVFLIAANGDYELHTVLSVVGGLVTLNASSSLTIAWIMHALRVTLTTDTRFLLDGAETAIASFSGLAVNYPDLTVIPHGLTTLSGVMVRTTRPLRGGSAAFSVLSGNDRFVPDIGPFAEVEHYPARDSRFHTFSGDTVAALFAEEVILHHLSGQANDAWLATWLPDYVLTLPVATLGTTLTVATLPDGSVPPAIFDRSTGGLHVVTNAASGLGTTILTVTPGVIAGRSAGYAFSRAARQRLATDTVELEFTSRGTTVIVQTVEVEE